MRKALLIVTAVLEAAIGLALVAAPSLPIAILLGLPLDTLAGQLAGRVAGAALLSLAAACWLGRHEERSRARTGLVAALLFYNIAAASLLAHAALGSGLRGPGIWPAVVLHAALAVWCVACLRTPRP